jgi:resolvase-like protein
MTTDDDDPRIVYGYIRSETASEIHIAAERHEIAHFCRVQGYQLVTIFCDRRVPETELKRPGFTGVLDALSLREAYGVVVSHLDTLSSRSVVREALLRQIGTTRAQVIDMTKETT